MMSKQLAVSIAASVLAMAAYALLGVDMPGPSLQNEGPRWSAHADTSALPDIGQLLPTLQ
ncbi:hypothetical protein GCM10023306_05160 [Novosphingobium ginsenosidimutans]